MPLLPLDLQPDLTPVLALPDPRGELQRLVDHLLLEVMPRAGMWHTTRSGPGFEDHVLLGPRGQETTVTIGRGTRHRGGVCFSDGVTVTLPDGSSRHYALLMSASALGRLIALLRTRYQTAERERLRLDLRDQLTRWRGEPLTSSTVPFLGGLVERPNQSSLFTVRPELDGALFFPSPRVTWRHPLRQPDWARRYGCRLSLDEVGQLLSAEVAWHNAQL